MDLWFTASQRETQITTWTWDWPSHPKRGWWGTSSLSLVGDSCEGEGRLVGLNPQLWDLMLSSGR